MDSTLVLNATYEPLQVVSWRRAVRMLFQGKVEVVAEYERELRSVTIKIRMPSVLRLLHYVRVKPQHNRVRFSRANIYARDSHRCQYCAKVFPPAELTYDHVIPVARGGQKTWENIVTCCVRCNREKGDRTPEQADMRLLKAPKAPAGVHDKIRLYLQHKTPPESWRDFVFWKLEISLE